MGGWNESRRPECRLSGVHWSCFLDRSCTGWSETGKYLMPWSAQFSLDDFSASCSLFTLTPGTKAQSPMSLFHPRPRLALPPQAWARLTRHRPRWLTLPLPVLEVRMDGPKWRVNWTCRRPLNLAMLLTYWWNTTYTETYHCFSFGGVNASSKIIS